MDVLALERQLAALSEQLTAPAPGECLDHYLDRSLGQFGCTGHRFTRRWARSRRRGTEDGLVRWATARGGCCCDCEVVQNALWRGDARRRGGVLCAGALGWRRRVRAGEESAAWPTCSGVAG